MWLKPTGGNSNPSIETEAKLLGWCELFDESKILLHYLKSLHLQISASAYLHILLFEHFPTSTYLHIYLSVLQPPVGHGA